MAQGGIWSKLGMFLLCTGVLLIAFVAFQLWGTAFYTDHAQSNLRAQIGHSLHGRSSLPLSSLRAAQPGTDPKTAASSGPALPEVATSVAPTTAQPAVGQPIGILAIPKLGLDDVVVQGYGEAQLQGGPGHYQSTSLPGQSGNAAIAGHRTTYAAPFYDLNELVTGDPIFVLTSQGLFRYDVVSSQIVSPDDTAVLDDSLGPELTLTTCNPRYSASQRLVVVATLDTKAPGASKTHPKKPAPPSSSRQPPRTSSAPPGALAATTNGNGGDVLPAVLWGVGFLLGAFVLRIGARRLPRSLKWVSYLVGVPALLVVLFVCFEHVSLALPASF
jgi:sortase A